MTLEKLYLQNFRNHKELKLDFKGSSTLIVGPNGSGKTNILEATHLLSTTKSLRTMYDAEMISHNGKLARIEADIHLDDDNYHLELVIQRDSRRKNISTKKVKINKVAKTIQNFTGTLTSVLFTPRDLELFTGSPSIRRRYLDSIFFQTDKDYKRAHTQYIKAVRHRNKILEKIRDYNTGMDQLQIWNDKILYEGNRIQEKREALIKFLRKKISDYGNWLNGEKIDYKIRYEKNNITQERLAEYQGAEIASKTTLIGPHRDDFSVEYNGFDITYFGSRGQKRATILAMKLCEIDFISESSGKRPILLLDDIFSELDEPHQKAVGNIIDLQQTIITTVEENHQFPNLKRITLSNP